MAAADQIRPATGREMTREDAAAIKNILKKYFLISCFLMNCRPTVVSKTNIPDLLTPVI